jgi:hypothetical protein
VIPTRPEVTFHLALLVDRELSEPDAVLAGGAILNLAATNTLPNARLLEYSRVLASLLTQRLCIDKRLLVR